MKPLNFDNSPCSPTSSNCVIWGGPDLACINVCKGDSITDVVAKLATELCTLLDTFNISAYDISCFNLVNCAPQTFTDLINFLIVKVCELENATPSNGGGTNPSTGCPTECIITVAPCFVIGTATTMTLTDYAIAIGEKICAIIDTNALQQAAINSLDVRVTTLEDAPAPIIPTLEVTLTETLPSVPALSGTQPVETVVASYINQIWFPFVATTGNSGLLASAVSIQTVAGTDASKAIPSSTMSAVYSGIWASQVPDATIAGTINNIWACIKDLRDAPLQSPFYLYGTTTDAGNDKTTAIARNNSIYTIGADSYFNTVRVGLGGTNITTNTAVGVGVLSNNTTGNLNVGVGYLSLTANTSGVYNTAIGARSMFSNTIGNYNTAIGENALQTNQGGSLNTAVGINALSANVNGTANTAIGQQALNNNNLGAYNTAIGSESLQSNQAGANNTSIGAKALYGNTAGNNNVAIGYGAGQITSSSLSNINSTNCVYIGSDIKTATTSDTNQIVIGYDAIGQGSNTIQLGNTSIIRTYLQGDLTVSNATAVTTAVVSQTKHFPIVINGVTYKLLLAD